MIVWRQRLEQVYRLAFAFGAVVMVIAGLLYKFAADVRQTRPKPDAQRVSAQVSSTTAPISSAQVPVDVALALMACTACFLAGCIIGLISILPRLDFPSWFVPLGRLLEMTSLLLLTTIPDSKFNFDRDVLKVAPGACLVIAAYWFRSSVCFFLSATLLQQKEARAIGFDAEMFWYNIAANPFWWLLPVASAAMDALMIYIAFVPKSAEP